MVLALGARTLSGLRGNVSIPRQTGQGTFGWVAEDAAQADSEITLDTISLSPNTINAAVPFTRRLLMQSSPDVEVMVRQDLIEGAALGVDLGALNGGGGNAPTGILQDANVNTQIVNPAGQPTWSEIVGFETAVAEDNALFGSLAYLTTPTARGFMKSNFRDPGSGLPLASQNETNGYPLAMSTQLPGNEIIFGNWNQLIMGFWGVLEIVVDRATKISTGGIVLRAWQDADLGVRHSDAFCIDTLT